MVDNEWLVLQCAGAGLFVGDTNVLAHKFCSRSLSPLANTSCTLLLLTSAHSSVSHAYLTASQPPAHTHRHMPLVHIAAHICVHIHNTLTYMHILLHMHTRTHSSRTQECKLSCRVLESQWSGRLRAVGQYINVIVGLSSVGTRPSLPWPFPTFSSLLPFYSL